MVFVLDGVLIGAGDGATSRGAVSSCWSSTPRWRCSPPAGPGGLVLVWLAMVVVFMGARYVILTRRARSDAWLVTGAVASRA